MHPAEELERGLLTAPVRRSRAALQDLLHPDFTEIGASGRLWTRDELLDALELETGPSSVRAEQFVVREVAPEVVLRTFLTDRDGRVARRSSVWRHEDGRWRLVHHQGTLVPPAGDV